MIFEKSEDVVSRPEGNKAIILNQKTGQIYILNATSSFLFDRCTGDATAEQLADLLANRFQIPEDYAEPSRLLELVVRHLGLLDKARLLKPVEVNC